MCDRFVEVLDTEADVVDGDGVAIGRSTSDTAGKQLQILIIRNTQIDEPDAGTAVGLGKAHHLGEPQLVDVEIQRRSRSWDCVGG